MNYSKTQYGKLIISLFAIISLIGFLSFFFLRQVDEIPPLVIFGFPVIMFLTGLLFYKLNVSMEKDGVRLKYGIGLISLKFKMDEVEKEDTIIYCESALGNGKIDDIYDFFKKRITLCNKSDICHILRFVWILFL